MKATSFRISPVLRRELTRVRRMANEQGRKESGLPFDIFPSEASFVRHLLELGLPKAERLLDKAERGTK